MMEGKTSSSVFGKELEETVYTPAQMYCCATIMKLATLIILVGQMERAAK